MWPSRWRQLAVLFVALLLSTQSSFVEAKGGASKKTTKQPKGEKQLKQLRENQSAFVSLNDKTFNAFTKAPRPYTFIVLLTALGKEFQCVGCVDFEPKFKLLAESIQQQAHLKQDVFLGRLDFADGRDVFSRLNVLTAPTILLYTPTDGKDKNSEPELYNFQTHGTSLEPVVAFLNKHTNRDIKIIHPINYAAIAMMVLSVIGVLLAGYLLFVHFQWLLRSWQIWMALTVSFCLLFSGGHMWNQIREPPYVGAGRNGAPEWIAGGFSQQYQIETQIVASLYAFCAVALVAMVITGQKLHEGFVMKLACACSLFMALLGQGAIIQLFKVKNGGYPFSGILF